MTSHIPCKNVPTATYCGKEKSPLGNGLSAEGYEIGTKLKGCDHLIWLTKIKNGKKVWIRTELENETDEIQNNDENETDRTSDVPIVSDTKKPKKLTNYNLFLTYRLNQLKQSYIDSNKNFNNKDVFKDVLVEWKNIDKKSNAFVDIMKLAEEYNIRKN